MSPGSRTQEQCWVTAATSVLMAPAPPTGFRVLAPCAAGRVVWVDDDDDDSDDFDVGHVSQNSCDSEMEQESTDTDTGNAVLDSDDEENSNYFQHDVGYKWLEEVPCLVLELRGDAVLCVPSYQTWREPGRGVKYQNTSRKTTQRRRVKHWTQQGRQNHHHQIDGSRVDTGTSWGLGALVTDQCLYTRGSRACPSPHTVPTHVVTATLQCQPLYNSQAKALLKECCAFLFK
ncbi:uncharacterized protein O8D03_011922 [Erethizon dorsatum]